MTPSGSQVRNSKEEEILEGHERKDCVGGVRFEHRLEVEGGGVQVEDRETRKREGLMHCLQ